jgi:sulfur carrier protein
VELVINGLKQDLDVQTIQDVIVHYGLNGKPIVVEADGTVVTAEQWETTVVFPNMKVELVHFVGGG